MTQQAPAILNPAEVAALNAFAASEGRRWRASLTGVYWYNARIWRDDQGDTAHGSALHALRNRAGGYEAVQAFKPAPASKKER